MINLKIGIYKITSPTNRIYIGQSTNIEKRFKDYNLLRNCKTQTKLYRSLIKYNPNNHIFEIIEECLESELNERERYWQEYYNCVDEGLNCRFTKTDDKSGKVSKETLIKMSKNHTRPWLGKKHSEITKTKMSLKRKNFRYSEESKRKMSISQKNKPPFTKEAREKMSKNSASAKIVIDLQTGVFYNSIKEAAEIYGIEKTYLGEILNGKYKNKTPLVYA